MHVDTWQSVWISSCSLITTPLCFWFNDQISKLICSRGRNMNEWKPSSTDGAILLNLNLFLMSNVLAGADSVTSVPLCHLTNTPVVSSPLHCCSYSSSYLLSDSLKETKCLLGQKLRIAFGLSGKGLLWHMMKRAKDSKRLLVRNLWVCMMDGWGSTSFPHVRTHSVPSGFQHLPQSIEDYKLVATSECISWLMLSFLLSHIYLFILH